MPHRLAVLALVAEDDPLIRMEAADALGDVGFDVLEAGTAAKALEQLEQHPEVALLFTDVQMPGPFDGLALAHEARRRWPQMPIIVVSGKATPSPAQLPEGARFLSKPYHSRVLERLIREVQAGTPLNSPAPRLTL